MTVAVVIPEQEQEPAFVATAVLPETKQESVSVVIMVVPEPEPEPAFVVATVVTTLLVKEGCSGPLSIQFTLLRFTLFALSEITLPFLVPIFVI